jgi:hypothetical protein
MAKGWQLQEERDAIHKHFNFQVPNIFARGTARTQMQELRIA